MHGPPLRQIIGRRRPVHQPEVCPFSCDDRLQIVCPVASAVQLVDESAPTNQVELVALVVVASPVPVLVDLDVPVFGFMNHSRASDETCAGTERPDMVLGLELPLIKVPFAYIIFPPGICLRTHSRFLWHIEQWRAIDVRSQWDQSMKDDSECTAVVAVLEKD